jgi:hypothetical protein
MYLDDSGSSQNEPNGESHFVLGGFIAHEERLFNLKDKLDKLVGKYAGTATPSVEIHCSEIFSRRRPPWNGLNKEEAREAIKDVLKIVATQCTLPSIDGKQVTVMSCAVNKADYQGQTPPILLAFEDLSSRFQKFLNRQNEKYKRKEKGLIIIDKSTYESNLQNLAGDLSRDGTRWGPKPKNVLEVPMFVDSKVSRAIQLADAVAYAVFRRYSFADLNYFNVIEHCFELVEHQIHGLCHKTRNVNCTCPACLSKKNRQAFEAT